jgi:type IV secretory pathway VirB10-like protein
MLQMSAEIFKITHGKLFLFLDCLPILQQMPKFDPMCEKIEEIVIDDVDGDDDDVVPRDKKPAAVNVIGAPMGSGIPRPMGSKLAKRMTKDEHSLSSTESERTRAMMDLAASQKQLMEVLKEKMERERIKDERERLKDEAERREKQQERLYKSWEMFTRMGKMDKAAEVMKRIEVMDAVGSVAYLDVEVVNPYTEIAISQGQSPLSGSATDSIDSSVHFDSGKSSEVT